MDAQSRLLGARWPYWGNLGYWHSPSQAYDDAARTLAELHAKAIGLCQHDRLLELGSGNGASAHLWASYGVRELISLDRIRPQHLSGLPAGVRHQVLMASFEDPWLLAAPFDAIICVDALYHARCLDAVLAKIAAALHAQGRWALTTLHIEPHLSAVERVTIGTQLRLCGIAWPALWQAPWPATRDEISDGSFAQAGLVLSRAEDISAAVLMGFAEAIAHRGSRLSWRQRAHPAWWKLEMTARLCRSLIISGKVRYVLLSGIKR